MEEINAALISIQQFKIAYSNENGVITVGDIENLMANIDTIEECVRKQKRIPTTTEREFGLFGKSKIVQGLSKAPVFCSCVLNAFYRSAITDLILFLSEFLNYR